MADEPTRVLNPNQLEVLVRRQAKRRPEHANEVERAEPRFARELTDRDRSRILGFE